MGLNFSYGHALSNEESVKLIRQAVDRGVTTPPRSMVRTPMRKSSAALRPVRDQVRKVCGASLERLGVEVIDLLYQHRVDPNVPIDVLACACAKRRALRLRLRCGRLR
jgi:aryl-alcohol dehydrogenase-like predicted oxidoreductase